MRLRFAGRGRSAVATLIALGLTFFGTAAPALAATSCPRTTELTMESRLMCQVCGVPLALANSLEADRERALVQTLVDRCESPSQIEAAMVAQYGTSVLASPGNHGFAIAAWLVPVAGILGALVAIAAVIVLARRRRHGLEPTPPTGLASPSEEDRLDAALAALDAQR